jgi:hypothetical protein
VYDPAGCSSIDHFGQSPRATKLVGVWGSTSSQPLRLPTSRFCPNYNPACLLSILASIVGQMGRLSQPGPSTARPKSHMAQPYRARSVTRAGLGCLPCRLSGPGTTLSLQNRARPATRHAGIIVPVPARTWIGRSRDRSGRRRGG